MSSHLLLLGIGAASSYSATYTMTSDVANNSEMVSLCHLLDGVANVIYWSADTDFPQGMPQSQPGRVAQTF